MAAADAFDAEAARAEIRAEALALGFDAVGFTEAHLPEEARERLRADALAAWAEYEATGWHAAGEDVDAWLARLEAGEDAEPPPPSR